MVINCVTNIKLYSRTAHQASLSLSITNFRSLLKLMCIELLIPSNYLVFYRPLLFWPSIFSSIRVFSNELLLYIRLPKYWSFSHFNVCSGLIFLGLTGLIASRVFFNTTVPEDQFLGTQLSFSSNSHIST